MMTDGKLPGIEASAISILSRAVELDSKGRHMESFVCYQEGIQLLMDVIKGLTDNNKKARYRAKATEYMDRAEELKAFIDKEKQAGRYHEQIHIENNSTNHSYKSLLGHFLDNTVTSVEVEDPYIRNPHQVYNFLRFCEMLIKSCKNLTSIHLLTSFDEGQAGIQQQDRLNSVSRSLSKYNIQLNLTLSSTLHDRQIRLSNGWIIKIGRGLDYFKPPDSKFSIGYFDLDFRPCHETTVDIFHQNSVKPS